MPQGAGNADGAVPQTGGGATPDDVMSADQQKAQAKYASIAQSAPAPEKPFSVQAIKTLISQFNDTVETLSGGQLPDIEWNPAEGGAKWSNPLPSEIFVPLVALDEALSTIAPDMVSKYQLDAPGIINDTEVRKASGVLRMMQKDKKLISMMQQPSGGQGPAQGSEVPEAEGPEVAAQEQELSKNMA